MDNPLLSIAIPTYNRLPFLMELIPSLLSQIQEGVEILVVDNCSSDGTSDYLKTLGSNVRIFRQKENVGPDKNMISCLELSEGQYMWILCDDDLPQAQAISNILSAITAYDSPPILFLKSRWVTNDLASIASTPIGGKWSLFNRDHFLQEIRQYFSVASSIVVRRDCVEELFVRSYIGTNLVPAAITLSTVGKYNQAVVSDEPMVICLGGNSGGYNGLSTFSRGVSNLLVAIKKYGYQKQTLRNVYDVNLKGVVLYIVTDFKIHPKEFLDLFIASYSYRSFYTRVVPKLLARAKSVVINRLKSILGLFIRFIVREYYPVIKDELSKNSNREFRSRIRVGSHSNIIPPFYLKGEQYIKIGDNFSACADLRIEAWDVYNKSLHYFPQIIIGNNVRINFYVHIGAINKIVIGNDVLIGSHVLITDHQHGDLSSEILSSKYVDAPLFSKGPVVIEDNVWIGEGACIMPGVHIGKSAVIGANAVVTKNVLPGHVVGGVPAKVLLDLAKRD